MDLTPSELDRLLIFTAAGLAATRRDRGTLLNKPEAIALISHAVIEAARDGATHAQARAAGLSAVAPAHLMPGVAAIIGSVSVEAVFDDGRRLVVVDFPTSDDHNIPGEVVRLAPATPRDESGSVTIDVTNTATVGISVTTHYHFFEVNPRLHFDRALAYGMRLSIPSGEHVDFAPGITQTVDLIPIGGERVIVGFAGLVDGPLDAPGAKEKALHRAQELGYLS